MNELNETTVNFVPSCFAVFQMPFLEPFTDFTDFYLICQWQNPEGANLTI
jgi:hypothetical protein